MENNQPFLKMVINAVSDSIAVIDSSGQIVFVNDSWMVFGRNNECTIVEDWQGVNYLDECQKATLSDDEVSQEASAGIRRVISGELSDFSLEYPCHSTDEERWFIMRITQCDLDQTPYFVIAHQDITQRKIAERNVAELARLDGLTGINNRRTFDNFFARELRRCCRQKHSITLAIVDIDYFKLLNDEYGHQAGDKCLRKVAKALKALTHRPSDICARIGGEEFALIWSDCDLQQAKHFTEEVYKQIRALNIPNIRSSVSNMLTVSIGLCSVVPTADMSSEDLFKQADKCLYHAKNNGRNQASWSHYR